MELFRRSGLGGSLGMNALVSTVMMSTLVVGPFYLSRGLGLDAARVGLLLSVGPTMSALSGVFAGRLVDRWGAPAMVRAGLLEMTAGAAALALLPGWFGLPGYIAAIALLTPGYQLFQAGNNTAVMTEVPTEERGLVSGMLSLSRNLGLITGASVMGAVFAFAAGSTVLATASPAAVAAGLRSTFAVATLLILVALALGARRVASGLAQAVPEALEQGARTQRHRQQRAEDDGQPDHEVHGQGLVDVVEEVGGMEFHGALLQSLTTKIGQIGAPARACDRRGP
jgi:MFS family permease